MTKKWMGELLKIAFQCLVSGVAVFLAVSGSLQWLYSHSYELCSGLGPHPAIRAGTPSASTPQGQGVTQGLFSKAHLQTWALMGDASKQAGALKELLSDFCPFSLRPAEGGQSSSQFQGRPSEVWSQWQSQHHNQQSGDQHSHPQPSQTEVFQVRRVQRRFARLLAGISYDWDGFACCWRAASLPT